MPGERHAQRRAPAAAREHDHRDEQREGRGQGRELGADGQPACEPREGDDRQRQGPVPPGRGRQQGERGDERPGRRPVVGRAAGVVGTQHGQCDAGGRHGRRDGAVRPGQHDDGEQQRRQVQQAEHRAERVGAQEHHADRVHELVVERVPGGDADPVEPLQGADRAVLCEVGGVREVVVQRVDRLHAGAERGARAGQPLRRHQRDRAGGRGGRQARGRRPGRRGLRHLRRARAAAGEGRGTGEQQRAQHQRRTPQQRRPAEQLREHHERRRAEHDLGQPRLHARPAGQQRGPRVDGRAHERRHHDERAQGPQQHVGGAQRTSWGTS